MKKLTFYPVLFLFPLLFSCNQGNKSAKEASTVTAVKTDSLSKEECFAAIDSNDKADLKIKTLSDGTVTGSMVINYFEKGKNDGTLEGKFKGDTLFADYTFKIGTQNPVVYKNPLAFLKKDGKLILGVGQIVTSMGRSYFVKGKAIRFDKSKFTFSPVACK